MQFSPYDQSDYALQTRTGPVCLGSPLGEGMWNLVWAAHPELDNLLTVRYEDFDTFREMSKVFPFLRLVLTARLYGDSEPLRDAFNFGTPNDAMKAIASNYSLVVARFKHDAMSWTNTVEARLDMAQSLVDLREAAEVCRAVVAVDFRTRRRL